MIVAVALAASGLGTLVASLVRTPEQGNVIGGVISMAMGVFGGAFFSTAIFPASCKSISNLTITYWGTDAFTQLAQNQTDIGTNLIVLFVMGDRAVRRRAGDLQPPPERLRGIIMRTIIDIALNDLRIMFKDREHLDQPGRRAAGDLLRDRLRQRRQAAARRAPPDCSST